METNVTLPKSTERLQILLIGNNPIDMSRIVEKANQINGPRVITEIAFDIKSLLERLLKFHPNFILIDDNIGKSEMSETVKALTHSNKTKNVPITVLKNSNYEDSFTSTGVLDYLLKTNLSPDSLYKAVRNSLKFRRTQLSLYKVHKRRK